MGDITNTDMWRHAFVYVSFDLNAAIPATIDDPFGVDWDDLGILVKGGPTESSAWGQNTSIYGRNGELLAQYVDELAWTLSFSCHEDNDVTKELRGIESGSHYGIKPKQCLLGFEYVRPGSKMRQITDMPAQVVQNGEIPRAENAVTSFPFQAVLFPNLQVTNSDGDPRYLIIQESDDLSS